MNRKPADVGQLELWPPDQVVWFMQERTVRGREAGEAVCSIPKVLAYCNESFLLQ